MPFGRGTAYVSSSKPEYMPFVDLKRKLDIVPMAYYIGLLGDFNAHMSNNSRIRWCGNTPETW